MLRPTATSPEFADRFARLLDRLGRDGEPPVVVYERLRAQLIRYFRLHLPWRAEELADIALDRLAIRLGELEIEHPAAYVHGIARNVQFEALADEARAARAGKAAMPEGEDEDERRREEALFAALDRCLDRLDPAARKLLLDYYGASTGRRRIMARRRLAKGLGISLNALRNRALRLRQTLECCVSTMLEDDSSHDET